MSQSHTSTQPDNRRLSLNKSRPQHSQHNRAKPKAKPAGRKLDGHEYDLLNLKRESAAVAITTMSGASLQGELADFDRFSITLNVPEIGRKVIFKHAIESFSKAV